MSMTNVVILHSLKVLALYALVSTELFAQRGLPQMTDTTTYTEAQRAHVAVLQSRIDEGKRQFLADREMRIVASKGIALSSANVASKSLGPTSSTNTESKSDVLVSFPFRMSVTTISKYVNGLDATVVALHRSVGDDQLSIGAPTNFENPEVDAQLRRDFLAYLEERETNMLSEITRTDPETFGRFRAEANLLAVVRAREATISSGVSFDGVLVRLPDSKLLAVHQLPDGVAALLVEIQSGTRRRFAIPLDVLRTSKNAYQ